MYGESSAQHSDVLLSPFLNATSEAESENQLTSLLEEQAGPVIKRIIRRKLDDRLRSLEAEDVYCEVVTHLVERLQQCKSQPISDGIRDFRNYVAVTTYNACYEVLRTKYPQRRRLKNRLKYLLTHHAAFSLWQTPEGYWLGGFASWMSKQEASAPGKLQQLFETPGILASAATGPDVSCETLVDLLQRIFRRLEAPIEFEALVNSVAGLQGIKDVAELTEFDETRVKGASESFDVEIEHRSYLRRLWSEIVQLPLSQRIALLLNLRDINDGVVMLLPVTGVATIRQIAETLEIPAEEFSRLWNQLPLDDAAIAVRLGITRQGVINLRKSARARLFRRMRGITLKGSAKVIRSTS